MQERRMGIWETTTGKLATNGILQAGNPITSALGADLATCIIWLAMHQHPYKRNGVRHISGSVTSTFPAVPACDILLPSLMIPGYER